MSAVHSSQQIMGMNLENTRDNCYERLKNENKSVEKIAIDFEDFHEFGGVLYETNRSKCIMNDILHWAEYKFRDICREMKKKKKTKIIIVRYKICAN